VVHTSTRSPHINTIASLAITFKLAKTKEFEQLQTQIIKNAVAFANQLQERNIRVPYGGTDTHIVLLDCKSIKANDGAYLSGDMGVRILDAAGIVANRNTIPFSATSIRFGSTWLTQRGFKENEFRSIANIISDLFENITPYNIPGTRSPKRRAKVAFKSLEIAKLEIESLAEKAIDFDKTLKRHGYPHFYTINDNVDTEWASFRLSGDQIRLFLSYTLSSDVEGLKNGESQPTLIHTSIGDVKGVIKSEGPSSFILTVPGNKAGLASAWLRDLSDAYIKFDQDLLMRVPGPMRIEGIQAETPSKTKADPINALKPFYIGIRNDKRDGEVLSPFKWEPASSETQFGIPQYLKSIWLSAKLLDCLMSPIWVFIKQRDRMQVYS